MSGKVPILLSYYGLSNQSFTLFCGQVTYTRIKDLSFQEYTRQKTFRTLLRLYQTKPYANQGFRLVFDTGEVKLKTNGYGAFYEKVPGDMAGGVLQKVILEGGQEVKLIEGLYHFGVDRIDNDLIVVSDIDDTLVHSFIYKKLRKFRTLMFTTMEKRRAVVNMQELIKYFTEAGGAPIYLSNSEQNLYPMIYRFLYHNKFPAGPLFLKHMRSLWDVIRNIKFPPNITHKTNTLEELMQLFPDKKFVLMGDNTQHDLQIYLSLAEKYHANIRYIIIRKVVEKAEDEELVRKAGEQFMGSGLTIYYSDRFPSTFKL